MKDVRTRFAPSPTGFLHAGGVRTALFAWLFARTNKGAFILRIEDTDKSREIEGSVDHIIESLDWLGLDRDEGPKKQGDYGPYLQSERLDIYKKYAQKLIDEGQAYADPYTSEQVSEFREQAKASKIPFLYRNHRPEKLETPDQWYGKVSIRFKTPAVKRYTWQDMVRGELTAGEEALDDFVLIKADGYPTYNFAHVVDDHEMKISHVIRGEEFIPSIPKFLSLHEALGFEFPHFITVPPILNENGGKKLSKRDGAKDVLEYRDGGYSPDVIANFLASLGWNDGTTDEIFTLEELVQKFDESRIQRSGAKFDETKLEWMRWQHSLRMIDEDPEDFLSHLGYQDEKHSEEFAHLAASKARSEEEFKGQYDIFANYQQAMVEKLDLRAIDKSLDAELAIKYIQSAQAALESVDDFNSEQIEESLRSAMAENDAAPRAFLNLVRWVLTNKQVSPNLFQMAAILGKPETLARLSSSIDQ